VATPEQRDPKSPRVTHADDQGKHDHAASENGTTMLSAHERRELRDIEQRLHAEDPQFARALTGAKLRRRYVPAVAVAVLALVLIILGVATGGFPLLFFGFVTAMIAGCLGCGSSR
jgi:hypothetical protein